MTVEVRRLAEHEWPLLRSVRLRALTDSPSVFATTANVAAAWSPSIWKEWLQRAVVLVAADSAHLVGMVSSAPRASIGERGLAALWVAPQHRGAGVGAELIRAFLASAHGDGAERVTMWASPTNTAAWRLYESFGFARTGAAKVGGHGEVVELAVALCQCFRAGSTDIAPGTAKPGDLLPPRQH